MQSANDIDSNATCRKFSAMRDAIAHLRVRDKRSIFLLMRTAADQLTVDTFFPAYGFTAGEFAVGQVLSENNRKPSAPAVSSVEKEVSVTKPPESSVKSPTSKKQNKTLSRGRTVRPKNA